MSCSSIPKAELIPNPSPALDGKDKQIVDVRSGLQTCRGVLVTGKRILVPETCIYTNEGILIRSLARKSVEYRARVIASWENLVLLEADDELAEPSLKIAAADGKEGGYIQVEGNWYKIPGGFFRIDPDAKPGEPVFNDRGEFIGSLGRGGNIFTAPQPEESLAKSQTFKPPMLDPFRFHFGLGLPEIAWLSGTGSVPSRVYASSRLFLGASSGPFSISGGFEFLNPYLGGYAEIRYTHVFVSRIDDPKRVLSFAVGPVAVKPKALGTEKGEQGVQVSARLGWGRVPAIEYSWIKTASRQLNEVTISPLTSFF